MEDLHTPSPKDALASLVEQLAHGRFLRITARPEWVVADRADGSMRLDVSWTEPAHESAVACLSEPVRLCGGHVAARCGDGIVLHAAADPTRRVDDISREGRISPLAGRLLSASVGLSRNVLLAGPWLACVDLGAALVAEGARPALLGGPAVAAPSAWPCFGSAAEVHAWGADRVSATALSLTELVACMSELSGVVGWLDAPRLERALIRYEAGLERATGKASNPLHVLAAVDLVVVLTGPPAPRVQLIAEICLTEEGYRPSVLFSTGTEPAPTALVPAALPSFADELNIVGHNVLVDELRHALSTTSSDTESLHSPRLQTPNSAAASVVSDNRSAFPKVPRVELAPAMHVPALDAQGLGEAEPPGWELDELGDEPIDEDQKGTVGADYASMAAAYGLGPPPAPPGAVPSAVEGSAFADALRRAKQREERLADDDDDSRQE